jgi:hypothetical protein
MVGQRHLIDKILARYSAPFTVFRELIQNANDADAEIFEILFQPIVEEDQKARNSYTPIASKKKRKRIYCSYQSTINNKSSWVSPALRQAQFRFT